MRNKEVTIQVKKRKDIKNLQRSKYKQVQEGKGFVIPFLVEVNEDKSNSIKFTRS